VDLAALGWTERLAAAFAPHESEDGGVAGRARPARVAAQDRTEFLLYTAAGEASGEAAPREGRGVLAGRLRHQAARASDLPAVGDWVVAHAPEAGAGAAAPGDRALITAVLPRTSVFLRKAAGRAADEQVVAANVDSVLIVTALDGDLNPRRLERYLAIAWESGALPAIVLTKADLEEDEAAADAVVADVAMGVPVHRVSSVTGRGLEDLCRRVGGGRTAALLGSSGVGKSTLVNALLGRARQRVADVRADGRGRHTTTRRELIPIPGGGFLLDTPGMRAIGLWEAERGLADAFPEIVEVAAGCRYRDCAHDGEPGCAVEEAVAAGSLPSERLDSYRKLAAELRALEARTDTRARVERKRRDRAGAKALSARLKEKYR
jgi:ribosome biogenesis GTPase